MIKNLYFHIWFYLQPDLAKSSLGTIATVSTSSYGCSSLFWLQKRKLKKKKNTGCLYSVQKNNFHVDPFLIPGTLWSGTPSPL
jgi:hypothetical protein